MDEQELNSSYQEVAPQALETNDHSLPENQEQSQVATEDVQEKNWREMRQRQKEIEHRLKQKEEMLEKLMAAQLDAQARQHPPQSEEPEDPDDEYIPAGKVKGIVRKNVQSVEDKLQALEQKIAAQERQKHIYGKYPDFDDVVNVETLELLEKKDPELAATIADSKDPYKMAIQSYKYIKALNIVDELPSAKRQKEVKQKLEANAKTVQSPQAYDKRPMAQAFKTTAADKTRLYEEMMFYAGQATGL